MSNCNLGSASVCWFKILCVNTYINTYPAQPQVALGMSLQMITSGTDTFDDALPVYGRY